MAMTFFINTISVLMAALLGFVAHRASLCTVRTVAEILSSRRAFMALAMLKTVLWVMAVSMPILLLWPQSALPIRSHAITLEAVVGGFVFGVGAALNNGCAFSTLGHLANGSGNAGYQVLSRSYVIFCIRGNLAASAAAPLLQPIR